MASQHKAFISLESKNAGMDKGCKLKEHNCIHIKYEWEVLRARKHWTMTKVGSLLI